MHWERLDEQHLPARESGEYRTTPLWRSPVPGGWFVVLSLGLGYQAFFYPDPHHQWDGTSLNEAANTLLRPAAENSVTPPQELLRPDRSQDSG